jgi:tripartite-type tricarboxylate transporter receptor subunit TctC
VMKAAPDGYTLLLSGVGFWVVPLLEHAPYDPLRDFVPISILANQPNLVLVHPSLPVKSVKDLIALAKAKPGELNYAATTIGGSSQLAAELFKSMAGGLNIVGIPYKGAAVSLTALLSGEVHMAFSPGGVAAAHIKSGRIKALAVCSAAPSALYPGLPTVAASGLPGYESGNTSVISAPARTQDAIITRLNQEIIRVLNRPDVKEKFFNIGFEVIGSTPEQQATLIRTDMARLGKVIKDAGIKADLRP